MQSPASGRGGMRNRQTPAGSRFYAPRRAWTWGQRASGPDRQRSQAHRVLNAVIPAPRGVMGPHHPRETCPTEPQPCESSCHFHFADAASSDFSSTLHFTPHHRQSTEQAGQKATGVELDGQNMFGVPEDSACQEVQLSSRIREPRDIENRGKGTKMEMEANKTGRYRKRKPSMRASGVEPRESTGRGPEHRIDLLSQAQIRMVPQSGATVPVELWWCR